MPQYTSSSLTRTKRVHDAFTAQNGRRQLLNMQHRLLFAVSGMLQRQHGISTALSSLSSLHTPVMSLVDSDDEELAAGACSIKASSNTISGWEAGLRSLA